MNKSSQHNSSRIGSVRGFSLIELLVVVAILGILAAAVGVYINTADTKLRSFTFNLGSRFKQAKFEAIKRGNDVYLDFDLDNDGTLSNGYTMWADNNNDGIYQAWVLALDDANGNGVCDNDEGRDCVIATVVLDNRQKPGYGKDGPEIYDATDATITGGPSDPLGGPGGDKNIGDGVSATSNRFSFRPSGDGRAGSAYFYYPRTTVAGKVVAAGPWVVVVNPVGRTRLDEWQAGKGWKVNE